MGLSVDVAFNRVEAIKLLESVAYDLVLMDIEMPERMASRPPGEIAVPNP